MTSKYRPYFTARELTEVVSALKEHPNPIRIAIIKYLDDFILKINRGTIAAQVTLTGTKKDQLVNNMGLTPSNPALVKSGPAISPEECYSKWLADPTSVTPKELEMVMAYRYDNDMMSKEEEGEYIESLGIKY